MTKVKDLIEQLQRMPPDYEVKVWLPGSTITLGPGLMPLMPRHPNTVLIEGNLDPGSALS